MFIKPIKPTNYAMELKLFNNDTASTEFVFWSDPKKSKHFIGGFETEFQKMSLLRIIYAYNSYREVFTLSVANNQYIKHFCATSSLISTLWLLKKNVFGISKLICYALPQYLFKKKK